MNDGTVAPALTAEEWAAYPNIAGTGTQPLPDELPLYHPRRHGIAAANLRGQPFGFTRGDVELVRDCIGMEWDRGERGEMDALEKRLESLAARIAALLPPEA